MQTKIIEATNGFNWGKFMLGRLDHEWDERSTVSTTKRSLLQQLGWTPEHLWVLDLQTGEGAFFRMNRYGHAAHDLKKHQIWVCPLYEPFLAWLYQQELDFEKLPTTVEIPGAESALWGYRRPGK